MPFWHLVQKCVVPIALAVALSACDGKKTEVAEQDPGTNAAARPEKNTTISDYVEFVNSNDNQMSLDHVYTNEALRKLVAATNALAEEVDYDVRADMEKVKQYADQITKDPFETTHADNIRNAAVTLSTALQNMQREKFPDLREEADEVRKACEAIDPDQLTLDQKDAVRSFFREAANLLQKMES